ncbi:Flavin carrier protein 1 like [Verticillium longisporum]|uniref:Flavin carrier protein 1 like n=1 Tax=Verticillium longisporum TaxID=100787 RepID=A0A8I2ZLM6_VERLO|nr:Flavin carrier protein 1 like [Verticillium longisporum]
MRWSPLLLLLSAALSPVVAIRKLESKSLNTCQSDSMFSASLFNVVFTPDNGTATVNIVAVSSVQGSVVFDISLKAYGYEVIHRTIDPCDIDLAGLCPMTADKINLKFNIDIDEEATKVIPGIAFSIPDLDATFRAYLNLTETGESVACVEADFSNGKTVDLVGVKWATALIAILGLIAAAVVSGMLTGVHLPPVVQAWTQNFMWSMGIIRVGWMQDVFTWYQRATGGEPSTLFNSMRTSSVQVTKRSVDFTEGAAGIMARAGTALAKRANIQLSSGSFIVYGIQRVAFRAKIESTNLFMTGLTFYCIFAVLTVLVVALFKGFTELCVRQRWMKSDSFLEFRNGWLTVLKGILFRVTLIGFPMMTILCLWELTQRDSPAEVVLAIFFFFGMLITLGWASFKVIRIARRSVAMHRNPAYILYSDPQALNKWGFLYVQFRASAYYFIAPTLLYTLIKGMFVAFGQHVGVVQAIAFMVIEAAALIAAHRNPAYILYSDPQALNKWGFLYVQFRASAYYFIAPTLFYTLIKGMFVAFGQHVGVVQAIAFMVIEAAALIAASVLRPWMDKSINSFNIAICVMNFLNSVFLFMMTNVYAAPDIVPGATGVVLFIANAAFSLILLIMVIISSTIVFWRKNPDAKYQFMADDRVSFMKSQTQLNTTTELDALAATARGDKAGYKSQLDLDDDNESISSESMRRRVDGNGHPLAAQSQTSVNRIGNPPRSPVDPSVPLFPADNRGSPYASSLRSPSPYGGAGGQQSLRQQHNASPAGYRSQNNASPWQRGAGYEH